MIASRLHEACVIEFPSAESQASRDRGIPRYEAFGEEEGEDDVGECKIPLIYELTA